MEPRQNSSRKINQVKCAKNFLGKNELTRHLEGDTLTMKQAIRAFCYECMGYYDGGKEDCKATSCSLYPFNPYGSARRRREYTPEQRQEMRMRFMANLAKTKK